MADKSPSLTLAAHVSLEKSLVREQTPQMEEDTVETIAALQAKLAEKDKQLQEQIQGGRWVVAGGLRIC